MAIEEGTRVFLNMDLLHLFFRYVSAILEQFRGARFAFLDARQARLYISVRQVADGHESPLKIVAETQGCRCVIHHEMR